MSQEEIKLKQRYIELLEYELRLSERAFKLAIQEQDLLIRKLGFLGLRSDGSPKGRDTNFLASKIDPFTGATDLLPSLEDRRNELLPSRAASEGTQHDRLPLQGRDASNHPGLR